MFMCHLNCYACLKLYSEFFFNSYKNYYGILEVFEKENRNQN